MKHSGPGPRYHSSLWVWSHELGSWQTLGTGQIVYSSIQWQNANWGRPATLPQLAETVCINKMAARLVDARTQFNALVTLGEARETATMIAGTARRVAQGMLALRKGNVPGALSQLFGGNPSGFAGAKSVRDRVIARYTDFRLLGESSSFTSKGKKWVAKRNKELKKLMDRVDSFVLRYGEHGRIDDLAGAWMSLNFGWRPLLSDIDNAARYLALKRTLGPPKTVTVRVKHSVSNAGETTDTITNSCQQVYGWYWKDESSIGYTYELSPKWLFTPKVIDELSATRLGEIKRNWRHENNFFADLGFTDPASVVWNLLPLSFVTDWFVNVGQVLQSLHEFNQWKVERALKSEKSGFQRGKWLVRQSRGKHGVIYCGYSNYSTDQRMDHPYQHLDTHIFKRSLVTSLPTAVPLRIKVTNPFDLKTGQMASAAALLRYAFR